MSDLLGNSKRTFLKKPLYYIIDRMNRKSIYINTLIITLSVLIPFFRKLIRKDENLWIFGESYGLGYSGNSKYLFKYVTQNTAIKAVWLTRCIEIKREIIQEKGRAELFLSFSAIRLCLKAGTYAFSHGAKDLLTILPDFAIVVNLWHGMPIKRIDGFGHKISKIPLISKIVSYTMKPFKYEDDMTIITSGFFREHINLAFPHTKMIVETGEPRDDIFYMKMNKKEILQKFGINAPDNVKIVSYLPTFRDNNTKINQLHIDTQFSDVLIITKYHRNSSLITYNSNRANSIVLDAIDTQELLYVTDILVSDYSSCIFNFLHTGRPIVLFAYDFEDYSNQRGFCLDYFSLFSDIIVKNKEELDIKINRYLSDPCADQITRIRLKQMFQTFSDEYSSKRVYEEIIKLQTNLP